MLTPTVTASTSAAAPIGKTPASERRHQRERGECGPAVSGRATLLWCRVRQITTATLVRGHRPRSWRA
ncbi:hypothetical protein GCM10010317_064570 [Streptomyces mirabilis]|nr:hypothetical protein GCM10010317_064570 [Streptomyces mirabilis]